LNHAGDRERVQTELHREPRLRSPVRDGLQLVHPLQDLLLRLGDAALPLLDGGDLIEERAPTLAQRRRLLLLQRHE
jgi:hypothetical protein